MSTTVNRIFFKLKWFSCFIPFTWYFLVFLAVVIPGYLKLKAMSELPDSAYKSVFTVLLTLALLFGLSILCFALVTTLVSFCYLKWQHYNKRLQLQLNNNSEDSPVNSKQGIAIVLQPILMPLMGFIKLRVEYGKEKYSHKITPSSSKSKWLAFKYEGLFFWHLPEIREYQIDSVVLYIEDFFHFFSFALTLDTANRFHVLPQEQNLKNFNSQPRKTEETDVRIEELKRVEGELINYKNFESSDDVRRIVWKIYAKNKELVVRIPEIMDPYASHMYFYPSFHTFEEVSEHPVIGKTFLNRYKTVCWSVYQQLLQKGFEVSYLPDQLLPPATETDKLKQVQLNITNSQWQTDTSLSQFVKPNYASVVLISGLNDKEEIQRMVEQYGNDIVFLLVPLSNSIHSSLLSHWLYKAFVISEKEDNKEGLTRWTISTLRQKLIENEKQLKAILKQTHKSEVIEA
jgi:hypothetical protein